MSCDSNASNSPARVSRYDAFNSNKSVQSNPQKEENAERNDLPNENLLEESATKISNQADQVKNNDVNSKDGTSPVNQVSTTATSKDQCTKHTTEKAGEKYDSQVSSSTNESANCVQSTSAGNIVQSEKLKQIENKINDTKKKKNLDEINKKIQNLKEKMDQNDESTKNEQKCIPVPDENTETIRKDNLKPSSDTKTSTSKQNIVISKTNADLSYKDALVNTPKANAPKNVSAKPVEITNKAHNTKSSSIKNDAPSKKSKSIKKIEISPDQNVKNNTTEKKSLAVSGKNNESNSNREAIKRRFSNDYSAGEGSSTAPPAKKQRGAKICEFYARGYCWRGNDCWNTHDLRDKVRSEPRNFKLVADFKMTINSEKNTVNARIERSPDDDINDLNNARVRIIK